MVRLPDPGDVLADAAFGARPGLAVLPPARTPLQHWHRAVALGGTGRYAAARTELAVLTRATADPVLRSLALSTAASLVRQSGGHAAAAGPDGRAALAVAGLDPAPATADLSATPDSREAPRPLAAPDPLDAWCDALTGLAADALGSARPALAFRLLRRVDAALDGAIAAARPGPARPRAVLRGHWVTAETALSVGDPATALRHACAAVALAERMPSARHRVKSALVRAAATAAAGRTAEAAALAGPVADACAEHDLLPLRWATAMLRSGLGAGAAAAEAGECAAILRARGGLFAGPAES